MKSSPASSHLRAAVLLHARPRQEHDPPIQPLNINDIPTAALSRDVERLELVVTYSQCVCEIQRKKSLRAPANLLGLGKD